MSDILLVEQATPSTPSSGQRLVYPKSGSVLAHKDDAGTEYLLAHMTAALTSGRFALAGAGGALTDSAAFTYSGSDAIFTGNITALKLIVSNIAGDPLLINSAAANGGYATWQRSGVDKAYFGAAKQLNGSLSADDFGIDVRGGGIFYILTGGVVSFQADTAGDVTLPAGALVSKGALAANQTSAFVLDQPDANTGRLIAFGPDAATAGAIEIRQVANDGTSPIFVHTFDNAGGLTLAGALTLPGNLTAGDNVADAHTITGALSISGTNSTNVLKIAASGGDLLAIQPFPSGSGAALITFNAGLTDFEPATYTAESHTFNYRTGVGTAAAGITLDSSGNTTLAGLLNVSGVTTTLGSGTTGTNNAILNIDSGSGASAFSSLGFLRNSSTKTQIGVAGANGQFIVGAIANDFCIAAIQTVRISADSGTTNGIVLDNSGDVTLPAGALIAKGLGAAAQTSACGVEQIDVNTSRLVAWGPDGATVGVLHISQRASDDSPSFTHTFDNAGKLTLAGDLAVTGTTINMTTSGTTLTVGVGADNGTVSAGVFTDRTKYYEGDALAELRAIRSKDGHIDHDTLPAFARANVKKGEETVVERDLGASISMLTVGVGQLDSITEELLAWKAKAETALAQHGITIQ